MSSRDSDTRGRFRRQLDWLVVACLLLVVGTSSVSDRRGAAGVSAAQAQQAAAETVVPLPNREGTLKFAVLGDFGTGDKPQYELAQQMAKLRAKFPFELVVTVGDNIYGSEGPSDFKRKFEEPYKALLSAGVRFYASLGNHDSRGQRFYKLFNMEGRLYYSFSPKADVRFFALDTTYPTPAQIEWLDKELAASTSDWKIPYFHHPLYSSGDRHGSDVRLRRAIEPLFLKHNVSVVFSGHDHMYERVLPQQGIAYFVVGSGGKLREGDIELKTGLTAKGFDTDLAFMAVEIDGDQMFFNTISRPGAIVDSGVITRRTTPR